jgi:flagellin-specific chaperone FliS
MMRSENVQEAGHLQINKNVIIDLADLHKQLLFSQEYQDYTASFYKALPFITELKTKQNTHDIHDIEVALNFLYGILMLKLQHKDITEGTQKALDVITKFLVQLSSKYKQYKEGTLKLDLD